MDTVHYLKQRVIILLKQADNSLVMSEEKSRTERCLEFKVSNFKQKRPKKKLDSLEKAPWSFVCKLTVLSVTVMGSLQ